jgi:hypothetical protein
MPSPTTYTERATDVVTDELGVIEEERDAFRRFARRLDRVDPRQPTPKSAGTASAGGMTAAVVEQQTADSALREVRTAYRETVMATPHFEREYGESLAESMATEFGPELASQIAEGASLTPVAYAGLREATAEAISDRTEFLRVLRRERESLERCAGALTEIQSALDDLYDRLAADPDSATLGTIDAQLQDLEAECETLSNARQQTVHNRSGVVLSGVDETSLAQYLYAGLETVCPALSDVTECTETIRGCRERCLR